MDKNLLNYAGQITNGEQGNLYQNSLVYKKPPEFCVRPYWYISNGTAISAPTKTVRIADDDYNYIDYLEATTNINCYTYRSEAALDAIRDKIKKSYEKIEKAGGYNGN